VITPNPPIFFLSLQGSRLRSWSYGGPRRIEVRVLKIPRYHHLQYCLKYILLIASSTLPVNDMNMNGILKQLYGILLILSVNFSGEFCNAQATNTATPGDNTLREFGFPVGEELIYKIYWGIIPVGTATIKNEWIKENGRKLLAIRYKTHTNRIFDTIYPVDDTAESIINPENFLPLKFTVCLTRRNSRNETEVTFDHSRLKAIMVTKKSGMTRELDIDADTRDIITFLYYSRSTDLLPRQTRQCRIVTDLGLLNMKLKTFDYENVDLDIFGKISCLRLDPITKLDTMLIENGRVMSWIAKERCLATRMTINAPLANVSIELSEVHGPGNDFWSKAMKKKAIK